MNRALPRCCQVSPPAVRARSRRACSGRCGNALPQPARATSGARGCPPSNRAGHAGEGQAVIQIWLGAAVAPRYVRSQAGGGQRLLRTAEQPDRDQRRRDPHLRVAPVAGQAGRQVLAHPQHDPRRQRPETAAYLMQTGRIAGRPAGLSLRRGRGLATSRATRHGYTGLDSALHRAHAAAGPVLRGGIPRAAYKPFATGGDPSLRFEVEGIVPRESPTSGSAVNCCTTWTCLTRPCVRDTA